MKILLINPSQLEVYGGVVSPSYPPLGLGYIGAVLERRGHDVKILDMDADAISKENLKEYLSSFNPSAVGITTTTPTFKNAELVAKTVKEFINIPIILGGIHATIAPEDCISSKYIDFIIRGEGEQTIIELVDALENKKDVLKIDGLTYKNGKKIIHNKDKELIKDLDSLPFPARHLFNQQKYTYPDALHHPAFPIITSRGCSGFCTFCCVQKLFKNVYRFRSAKNVVDEIEFLIKNHKAKEIHIWDDNFILAKKRVFEIKEEMKKRGIKIPISFPNGVRVDQVSYDILKALREMGVYGIAFGVESGNQQILNNVKKGTTIKQIEDAFKLAKSIGFEIWGFFMFGLPGENKETINETIELAKRLDPDIAKFHILKPYPGTEIFYQLMKDGLITNANYSDYGIHTRPVHRLPDLSEDELLDLQKKAYREFYLRPKKVIKQILRLKTLTRINLNIKAAISILRAM